jgi:hypothetical protein
MLPFSPNIESQFRFRDDCFNDICDVPIIPKGQFVPFAIISDSDNVGEISILCWDTAFEFNRRELFYKEGCIGDPVGIYFSKTYYSDLSPQAAEDLAYKDVNYIAEGQAYANEFGICDSHYALNSVSDYFLSSTGDKFKLS